MSRPGIVEEQLTRVLGAWAAGSVLVQGAFLLVLDTTAARRLL